MNLPLRFPLTALLSAAAGACSCLLVLTVENRQLERPAVQRWDLSIQMGAHASANPSLTRLMLALTWIGSIKVFGTALAFAIILLLVRKRNYIAAFLGFGMGGALLLNEWLKLHFHRLRPQVPWSIGDEHTFSFPSGHSLFAVVLYGSLLSLTLHREDSLARRAVMVMLGTLLIVGIGTSRIYLGMHYPTDVAAGYLSGALWLAAALLIDRAWRTRASSPHS